MRPEQRDASYRACVATFALRAGFDPAYGLRELFDGTEAVQSLDDPRVVQRHVLVDQHVAESRQLLQIAGHGGRKPGNSGQIPDRFRVILEAEPVTGGELAGDIDHHLADDQQRMEDVVAQRNTLTQGIRTRDPEAKLIQVIEVPAQLCQPIDDRAHRANASSLSLRSLASQGSRSAARIWMSRT